MPRQTTEAVFIHNNDADFEKNSKSEFRQPAVPRIITTREPPGGEGRVWGGREEEGEEGQAEGAARGGGGGGDSRAESLLSLTPWGGPVDYL